MRSTSSAAVIFAVTLSITTSGCGVLSSNATSDPAASASATESPSTSSNGPIFHILAGELYGRDKQYAQAADHYGEIALNSDNTTLIERAIQAAIFAERFDLAQQLAERLRELDPGNARAAAVMMIASLELGETEQADRALNEWLEADASNVEKIFNEIGQYLRKSLDRDRAVAYTHHLAERFPRQYEAQVVVAKLALSFGEVSLAQQAADRAMSLRPEATVPYDLAMVIADRRGDVQEALRILKKAHARFPGEGRYISGLIEARMAADQRESALALLEKTLERKPSDPNLLRNLALFAYELERPDLADRSLKRLEAMPGQADMVHLIRGRVALKNGDLAAAEEALSQVSDRSEHFTNAQVLLAGARIELSRPDAAVQGLEHALLSDGIDEADRQQLTLALASTLAETGRLEDSLEVTDRAIAAWPEANDFRMQKAMALFALERTNAAIAALREIINRDPEHAPALNALGYTLADGNRNLEEAERLITRALHIEPDNPAFLDSLGWLKFRQGEIEKALEVLEAAFRQSPNAEVGAHLGEVLWADGQRERAMTVWQRSLELNPADSTLLDTLRRLAPELLPADGNS
ncbi:tetratricopeptide repeat protein [Guyparkeria hydrothermalis]|uniref:tetratricopeptide repeat protein n=1 Tax=Guyparkeria hydrothermalis TaxID=923 RepID=UPI00202097E9|nr:tetratricopeptide repeat protein [Guyparkeria hydrothermalis]MCL7743898.1 tetratricopeptide repeat protein [Guyparkeria hydrothermalis]